jgi:hypothetical protein
LRRAKACSEDAIAERRFSSMASSRIEGFRVLANPFDIVHDQFPVMAGLVPAIHVLTPKNQLSPRHPPRKRLRRSSLG